MTPKRLLFTALLAVPALVLAAAGVAAGVAVWDLELAALTYEPEPLPSQVETPPGDVAGSEEAPVARWHVDGNELTPIGTPGVRAAREAQVIWDRFVALTPVDQRTMLAEFEVFDGTTDMAAAVTQTEADPGRWILSVHLDEARASDLDEVLIHEFGHLLTLNADQVPPDAEAPETYTGYRRRTRQCAPLYYTGEGCARNGSYIDEFVERFWPPELLAELEEVDATEDEDEWEEAQADFAARHEDRFVTPYAATHPGEDIAESWTSFVLERKPRGDSIADEKIRFFWEYPELVALREQIRAEL